LNIQIVGFSSLEDAIKIMKLKLAMRNKNSHQCLFYIKGDEHLRVLIMKETAYMPKKLGPIEDIGKEIILIGDGFDVDYRLSEMFIQNNYEKETIIRNDWVKNLSYEDSVQHIISRKSLSATSKKILLEEAEREAKISHKNRKADEESFIIEKKQMWRRIGKKVDIVIAETTNPFRFEKEDYETEESSEDAANEIYSNVSEIRDSFMSNRNNSPLRPDKEDSNEGFYNIQEDNLNKMSKIPGEYLGIAGNVARYNRAAGEEVIKYDYHTNKQIAKKNETKTTYSDDEQERTDRAIAEELHQSLNYNLRKENEKIIEERLIKSMVENDLKDVSKASKKIEPRKPPSMKLDDMVSLYGTKGSGNSNDKALERFEKELSLYCPKNRKREIAKEVTVIQVASRDQVEKKRCEKILDLCF
jgi:hypothetical protein